jgi:anti-anti-sigma regulatory factor
MAQVKKSSRKAGSAVGAVPPAIAVAAAAQAAAAAPAVDAAAPAVAAAPTTQCVSAATPANVLQLGASLSIREVSECASRLKVMLASGPTVVDASVLESIDTAGIQLLLAAAVSAQRRGHKLKLLGALGVKTGAARALGLGEHLGELAEILP